MRAKKPDSLEALAVTAAQAFRAMQNARREYQIALAAAKKAETKARNAKAVWEQASGAWDKAVQDPL